MNTSKIRRPLAMLAISAAVTGYLIGQEAMTGTGRPAEPDNGIDPAEIAAGLKNLQHGPQLPNKYVGDWPTLPKATIWARRPALTSIVKGTSGLPIAAHGL
jgi:hypothetical protein